MTILKETRPIAKKAYRCMFCNCVIEQGQQYFRQTNICDGYIGDFVCHNECNAVAIDLDMFEDCDPDYGLDEESFCSGIDQYIYDHHFDDDTDDIQVDWQGLTKYQEVCKIFAELKKRNSMKASECKCCECGRTAAAFWPIIDPDIPSHPYCRKCLDKVKREMMIELLKNRKKK